MQFPKRLGNTSKLNFHLMTEMQELTPLAISRIFFRALFADSHLGNTKEYSLKSVVEMPWTYIPTNNIGIQYPCLQSFAFSGTEL
jgi:hypothetical protein